MKGEAKSCGARSRIPLVLLGLSVAFDLSHGVEEFHRKSVHDAGRDHFGLLQAGTQVGQRAHGISSRRNRHVELLNDRKEDRIERGEARGGLLRLLLLLLVVDVVGTAAAVCVAPVGMSLLGRALLAEIHLFHPPSFLFHAVRVAAVVVCIVWIGTGTVCTVAVGCRMVVRGRATGNSLVVRIGCREAGLTRNSVVRSTGWNAWSGLCSCETNCATCRAGAGSDRARRT